jgi:hypothetical protein
MRTVTASALRLIAALAVCLPLGVAATTPINFNPMGGGASGALSVGTFDWIPGNALHFAGNPPNGVQVGNTFVVYGQSVLGQLLAPDGSTPLALPANVEFTYVMGFPATVFSTNGLPNSPIFKLDTLSGENNFVEVWVHPRPAAAADMLAGTGFNAGTRILYGRVTNILGTMVTAPCDGNPQFDQFPSLADNDYPGVTTMCINGSTQVSVNIISLDPNYFPGYTPDMIDSFKSFFNKSNITPYQQQDPSRLFVSADAGTSGLSPPAPDVIPALGGVNGDVYTDTVVRDIQTQADANQSFEPGTAVPGTCRVTYGGNDKNGNIDPNKFGSACMRVKGNQENCYTFGGQVGASTADPAQGGPFGEHTHHQVSGPAGDFVFHAGTHSAPKTSRIEHTACKDPGACRQAVANASFKQIDFEGTGSFRTLDAVAAKYFNDQGIAVLPDSAPGAKIYWFRVDMDDTGEPGDKPSKKQFDQKACASFLAADLNKALGIADPLLNDYASCSACADVYQFYICKDEKPCEQSEAMYAVRGFLTGGNIQLHRVIK